MNREVYLQELRGRLSNRMSPRELENVMNYYSEYFQEAGPDRESEVIFELGSPERLAHQILGDQVARELEKPVARGERRKTSGIGTIWTVILALFAAPIAIPLAFGLALTALALLVAAILLVAGVGLGGIGCIAMGVFSAFLGISVVLSSGIATTMYFVGGGLITAGIGVLLFMSAFALSGLCFTGIARLFSRVIRRDKREAQA